MITLSLFSSNDFSGLPRMSTRDTQTRRDDVPTVFRLMRCSRDLSSLNDLLVRPRSQDQIGTVSMTESLIYAYFLCQGYMIFFTDCPQIYLLAVTGTLFSKNTPACFCSHT